MTDAVVLIGLVAVVAVLTVLAAYNGLAHRRQQVREAWAELDRQLHRRGEMVPPLSAVARSACDPVPATANAITTARNRAAVALTPGELSAAEQALSTALADLFAAPPPSLSAHPQYARHRTAFAAADRELSAAARRYNDAVAAYNAAATTVPQRWAAAAFGFRPQLPFDV